jgi:hypothetical protein
MPNEVTNWGQAIAASLTSALAMFFGAIPKIVGFLLILAVGWFIAALIAKGVLALLHKLRFNDLAGRAGFTGFVQKMEIRTDAAGVMAGVVKWFFRLIALVVAFDALGLPAISAVMSQFLAWLPNLVVAMAVLMIGGILANFASNLARGAAAEADVGKPQVFANLARWGIWAFAIIIAVNQIGIAETIVNALFIGVVAIIVLALGLSFGLGARDTAGEIVRRWATRSRVAMGGSLMSSGASSGSISGTWGTETAARRPVPPPGVGERRVSVPDRRNGGHIH